MSGWDCTSWMVGPIVVPLLASLVALLLGRRALPWLPWLVIFGIGLSLLGISTQLWEHGPQPYAIGAWSAPLGIDLYADGLSLLMLWMTLSIVSPVSLYALSYFRASAAQADYFWPLWLLLWTALNALFLAADLFHLYVTLELLTLAAVALVTLAGGAVALRAGIRYLLFGLLGSLSYLLGVILLYGRFGSLDIARLGETVTVGPSTWLAIAAISTGLLIKTAIFPLHVWLPHAHASAPAPVSALLSALVVKASFYLLLRVWFWVFPTAALAPAAGQFLGLMGAGAILYGSLQALRQARLKLLVAYSTVAQLGYLMLLFPLPGKPAWIATIVHVLSHGFAKAALFLAAGNMLFSLGHDRIKDLQGIAPSLPLTLMTFALAGVTIMGLPPSGSFLAKWLLLQVALQEDQWWWAGVILAGGLLAAAYIFRILKYAFANPETASELRMPLPLPRAMELLPLLLALLSLAVGLAGIPHAAILAIGSPFT